MIEVSLITPLVLLGAGIGLTCLLVGIILGSLMTFNLMNKRPPVKLPKSKRVEEEEKPNMSLPESAPAYGFSL